MSVGFRGGDAKAAQSKQSVQELKYHKKLKLTVAQNNILREYFESYPIIQIYEFCSKFLYQNILA